MNTATTTNCHFCQTPGRLANAPHWLGTEWTRIDVCTDCRHLIKGQPRRKRQPAPQPQLAGEWAMLGSMITGKSFEELRK